LQHPFRAPRNLPENVRHKPPHPQQIISPIFRRPDHHILSPPPRHPPPPPLHSHPWRIRPNHHPLAIAHRKTLLKRVLHPRPKLRPALRQNSYTLAASPFLHQLAKITRPA